MGYIYNAHSNNEEIVLFSKFNDDVMKLLPARYFFDIKNKLYDLIENPIVHMQNTTQHAIDINNCMWYDVISVTYIGIVRYKNPIVHMQRIRSVPLL